MLAQRTTIIPTTVIPPPVTNVNLNDSLFLLPPLEGCSCLNIPSVNRIDHPLPFGPSTALIFATICILDDGPWLSSATSIMLPQLFIFLWKQCALLLITSIVTSTTVSSWPTLRMISLRKQLSMETYIYMQSVWVLIFTIAKGIIPKMNALSLSPHYKHFLHLHFPSSYSSVSSVSWKRHLVNRLKVYK